MRRIPIVLIPLMVLAMGFLALSCKGNVPRTLVIPDKPTRTPVRTPSMTPTPTDTGTSTDTPTSSPTDTSLPTDTPTDTPSSSPTDTPTDTDTPVFTPTPTDTPTDTPTETPTDTPTDTPTMPPFSGSDFDTTTGWSFISAYGTIVSVGTESSGGCPPVSPTSGSYQGRMTCPTCSGAEAVTLLYTAPIPAILPNVVAVDIFSCGINRTMNIMVEDSEGLQTSLSTNTSCNANGTCELNVWDTLYIDVTATSLVDISKVYIINLGEMDNTSTVYVDNLRGLSSVPVGCP